MNSIPCLTRNSALDLRFRIFNCGVALGLKSESSMTQRLKHGSSRRNRVRLSSAHAWKNFLQILRSSGSTTLCERDSPSGQSSRFSGCDCWQLICSTRPLKNMHYVQQHIHDTKSDTEQVLYIPRASRSSGGGPNSALLGQTRARFMTTSSFHIQFKHFGR